VKIFISWSGERSKALAQALHKWLPMVLHYVEPWVSESDIAAGDRWAEAVSSELEASNFGIICITPENLGSEWVLFEAGALSKSMQDAKVIPLLFDLDFSEISGPLAQFQAKKVDQTGLNEVVLAINKVADAKADETRVKALLPALWPVLQELLDDIPNKKQSDKHPRTQKEILEELVTGVRGLDSRLHDIGSDFSDRNYKRHRRKFRRFHPKMFDEITYMFSDNEDDPVSFLLIGGMLRDELPWLAELFFETYREIRNNDALKAEKAIHRLRRVIKMTRKGPMMDMFMMEESKEAHMLFMELPMILDETLHRYLDKAPRISNEKDNQ